MSQNVGERGVRFSGKASRYDLLVCDFGLPDGTGADAIAAVRAHQQVKAIAMTGFGREEDMKRTREAGFALHLTKPVSFDVLRQAIERVLDAP